MCVMHMKEVIVNWITLLLHLDVWTFIPPHCSKTTSSVLTWEQGLTCCYCHKFRKQPIAIHMDAIISAYQAVAKCSDFQYAADIQ